MIDSDRSNNKDEYIIDDELLGSNSQIAMKLRQFYTAIQEEAIPDKFLDLLEKLDEVEQASRKDHIKGKKAHE